jgi:hypothetical protein
MKVKIGDGVAVPGTWDMKKLEKKVAQFLTDFGDMPLTGPIASNKRRVHARWNKAADTATITGIMS